MNECSRDRTYREAGVDRDRGDLCSKIAYEACLKTHKYGNRSLGQPTEFSGGFSGPVKLRQSLKGCYLVKNSDGVGSKSLVAQRVDRHHTLGHDLIAMNADDTASLGALPFVGTNSLDLSAADPALVEELMEGLVSACKKARLPMVGGEIAELPDQIKGYRNPYIWNCDLVGILEEDKMVDGSQINPGQEIIAVRSNGIRANGLTLARSICTRRFGDDWHRTDAYGDQTWGQVLLKPSLICAPAILSMVGLPGEEPKAKVSGIAHVTGGGISNLTRVLPEGTGADLNDPFSPQKEFLKLQEGGPVSDREAYLTWNMGQCMLIVSPTPRKALAVLSEYNLEGKICGQVRERKGISLQSKGKEGGTIEF